MKSLSFIIYVIAPLAIVSGLNISSAQAQNMVTGGGRASVGASAFGNNPNFSVNAAGTAQSPTNASTSATVNLIRVPAQPSSPSAVTKFGTSADQQSQAGRVNGQGTSASTFNIQPATAQITVGNITKASVNGGMGLVNTNSDANLSSMTGTGGANGGFGYMGAGQ
jgi:hypothetical protein